MFGLRDPRQVIQGRIEAKANRKVHDAKVAARGKVERKARGAAAKAKAKKGGGAAAPKPPAAAKKKKKMGWWPFGGSEEPAEIPACTSCAQEIDPSWPKCPYCGADQGGAAAGQPPVPNQGPPLPGGGPGPMPVITANKTMAVNIDALTATKRSVVGWLVVMSGNQKGMDFKLFEGKNALGAAADNDIVITDEYLSSKHASIRYEGGRYEFIDHDSTNGSFVNEKKVSKEELIDNDTVRLGRTEFRFKALY